MGTAYQVSAEDVANVLASNPRLPAFSQQSIEPLGEQCLAQLDLDAVEAAALYGDTLDEQTDYANDEIARQLRQLGVLMSEEKLLG
jgi:hypothetical protein